MPGFMPGIHVFFCGKTWMAGQVRPCHSFVIDPAYRLDRSGIALSGPALMFAVGALIWNLVEL
jgi:hypothetical protein